MLEAAEYFEGTELADRLRRQGTEYVELVATQQSTPPAEVGFDSGYGGVSILRRQILDRPITGFVGNAHNPTPLRFEEAFNMLKALVEVKDIPTAKNVQSKGGIAVARALPAEVDFEIGETITIKEGSFAGLPGSISEIKPESGKLTVLVSFIEKMLDEATRKIRVLVADDHAVVREGICALVNLQKDMLIVGEAVNGEDAIEKTDALLPNVVLMDIAMPVLNGIEAMRRITERCKDVKVLVLSQYDDEGNIAASREAGAFDFIPKKSVSSQLLEAIRMAC